MRMKFVLERSPDLPIMEMFDYLKQKLGEPAKKLHVPFEVEIAAQRRRPNVEKIVPLPELLAWTIDECARIRSEEKNTWAWYLMPLAVQCEDPDTGQSMLVAHALFVSAINDAGKQWLRVALFNDDHMDRLAKAAIQASYLTVSIERGLTVQADTDEEARIVGNIMPAIRMCVEAALCKPKNARLQ